MTAKLGRMATDLYDEGRLFSRYLGAEVRAEAARRNLSIAALARAMPMDRSQLTRYLDGARVFRLEALYAVADVLDQDPGYLVSQAYNRFLLDHPEIDHRDRSRGAEAEIIDFARANTPVEGVPMDAAALRTKRGPHAEQGHEGP